MESKYNLLTPRSKELNLCDTEAVRQYFKINKIDFIIHSASVGGIRGVSDTDSVVKKNLSMVYNLLNFKNSSCRVILFGSGAMYDRKRNLIRVEEREIGNFIPSEPYGKSKLDIYELVKSRNDVLCLNIFGCYGYYELETRFPEYAIKCALCGKDIEITNDALFDYVWIEDLNRIVLHFILNCPKYGVINVTPDTSLYLHEIANEVVKISGKKLSIKVINKKTGYEYTGSNFLLRSELKDFVFTPLSVGLSKLYRHNEKIYKQLIRR